MSGAIPHAAEDEPCADEEKAEDEHQVMSRSEDIDVDAILPAPLFSTRNQGPQIPSQSIAGHGPVIAGDDEEQKCTAKEKEERMREG